MSGMTNPFGAPLAYSQTSDLPSEWEEQRRREFEEREAAHRAALQDKTGGNWLSRALDIAGKVADTQGNPLIGLAARTASWHAQDPASIPGAYAGAIVPTLKDAAKLALVDTPGLGGSLGGYLMGLTQGEIMPGQSMEEGNKTAEDAARWLAGKVGLGGVIDSATEAAKQRDVMVNAQTDLPETIKKIALTAGDERGPLDPYGQATSILPMATKESVFGKAALQDMVDPSQSPGLYAALTAADMLTDPGTITGGANLLKAGGRSIKGLSGLGKVIKAAVSAGESGATAEANAVAKAGALRKGLYGIGKGIENVGNKLDLPILRAMQPDEIIEMGLDQRRINSINAARKLLKSQEDLAKLSEVERAQGPTAMLAAREELLKDGPRLEVDESVPEQLRNDFLPFSVSKQAAEDEVFAKLNARPSSVEGYLDHLRLKQAAPAMRLAAEAAAEPTKIGGQTLGSAAGAQQAAEDMGPIGTRPRLNQRTFMPTSDVEREFQNLTDMVAGVRKELDQLREGRTKLESEKGEADRYFAGGPGREAEAKEWGPDYAKRVESNRQAAEHAESRLRFYEQERAKVRGSEGYKKRVEEQKAHARRYTADAIHDDFYALHNQPSERTRFGREQMARRAEEVKASEARSRAEATGPAEEDPLRQRWAKTQPDWERTANKSGAEDIEGVEEGVARSVEMRKQNAEKADALQKEIHEIDSVISKMDEGKLSPDNDPSLKGVRAGREKADLNIKAESEKRAKYEAKFQETRAKAEQDLKAATENAKKAKDKRQKAKYEQAALAHQKKIESIDKDYAKKSAEFDASAKAADAEKKSAEEAYYRARGEVRDWRAERTAKKAELDDLLRRNEELDFKEGEATKAERQIAAGELGMAQREVKSAERAKGRDERALRSQEANYAEAKATLSEEEAHAYNASNAGEKLTRAENEIKNISEQSLVGGKEIDDAEVSRRGKVIAHLISSDKGIRNTLRGKLKEFFASLRGRGVGVPKRANVTMSGVNWKGRKVLLGQGVAVPEDFLRNEDVYRQFLEILRDDMKESVSQRLPEGIERKTELAGIARDKAAAKLEKDTARFENSFKEREKLRAEYEDAAEIDSMFQGPENWRENMQIGQIVEANLAPKKGDNVRVRSGKDALAKIRAKNYTQEELGKLAEWRTLAARAFIKRDKASMDKITEEMTQIEEWWAAHGRDKGDLRGPVVRGRQAYIPGRETSNIYAPVKEGGALISNVENKRSVGALDALKKLADGGSKSAKKVIKQIETDTVPKSALAGIDETNTLVETLVKQGVLLGDPETGGFKWAPTREGRMPNNVEKNKAIKEAFKRAGKESEYSISKHSFDKVPDDIAEQLRGIYLEGALKSREAMTADMTGGSSYNEAIGLRPDNKLGRADELTGPLLDYMDVTDALKRAANRPASEVMETLQFKYDLMDAIEKEIEGDSGKAWFENMWFRHGDPDFAFEKFDRDNPDFDYASQKGTALGREYDDIAKFQKYTDDPKYADLKRMLAKRTQLEDQLGDELVDSTAGKEGRSLSDFDEDEVAQGMSATVDAAKPDRPPHWDKTVSEVAPGVRKSVEHHESMASELEKLAKSIEERAKTHGSALLGPIRAIFAHIAGRGGDPERVVGAFIGKGADGKPKTIGGGNYSRFDIRHEPTADTWKLTMYDESGRSSSSTHKTLAEAKKSARDSGGLSEDTAAAYNASRARQHLAPEEIPEARGPGKVLSSPVKGETPGMHVQLLGKDITEKVHSVWSKLEGIREKESWLDPDVERSAFKGLDEWLQGKTKGAETVSADAVAARLRSMAARHSSDAESAKAWLARKGNRGTNPKSPGDYLKSTTSEKVEKVGENQNASITSAIANEKGGGLSKLSEIGKVYHDAESGVITIKIPTGDGGKHETYHLRGFTKKEGTPEGERVKNIAGFDKTPEVIPGGGYEITQGVEIISGTQSRKVSVAEAEALLVRAAQGSKEIKDPKAKAEFIRETLHPKTTGVSSARRASEALRTKASNAAAEAQRALNAGEKGAEQQIEAAKLLRKQADEAHKRVMEREAARAPKVEAEVPEAVRADAARKAVADKAMGWEPEGKNGAKIVPQNSIYDHFVITKRADDGGYEVVAKKTDRLGGESSTHLFPTWLHAYNYMLKMDNAVKGKKPGELKGMPPLPPGVSIKDGKIYMNYGEKSLDEFTLGKRGTEARDKVNKYLRNVAEKAVRDEIVMKAAEDMPVESPKKAKTEVSETGKAAEAAEPIGDKPWETRGVRVSMPGGTKGTVVKLSFDEGESGRKVTSVSIKVDNSNRVFTRTPAELEELVNSGKYNFGGSAGPKAEAGAGEAPSTPAATKRPNVEPTKAAEVEAEARRVDPSDPLSAGKTDAIEAGEKLAQDAMDGVMIEEPENLEGTRHAYSILGTNESADRYAPTTFNALRKARHEAEQMAKEIDEELSEVGNLKEGSKESKRTALYSQGYIDENGKLTEEGEALNRKIHTANQDIDEAIADGKRLSDEDAEHYEPLQEKYGKLSDMELEISKKWRKIEDRKFKEMVEKGLIEPEQYRKNHIAFVFDDDVNPLEKRGAVYELGKNDIANVYGRRRMSELRAAELDFVRSARAYIPAVSKKIAYEPKLRGLMRYSPDNPEDISGGFLKDQYDKDVKTLGKEKAKERLEYQKAYIASQISGDPKENVTLRMAQLSRMGILQRFKHAKLATALSVAQQAVALKALAGNFGAGVRNFVGGQMNILMNAGKGYTGADNWNIVARNLAKIGVGMYSFGRAWGRTLAHGVSEARKAGAISEHTGILAGFAGGRGTGVLSKIGDVAYAPFSIPEAINRGVAFQLGLVRSLANQNVSTWDFSKIPANVMAKAVSEGLQFSGETQHLYGPTVRSPYLGGHQAFYQFTEFPVKQMKFVTDAALDAAKGDLSPLVMGTAAMGSLVWMFNQLGLSPSFLYDYGSGIYSNAKSLYDDLTGNDSTSSAMGSRSLIPTSPIVAVMVKLLSGKTREAMEDAVDLAIPMGSAISNAMTASKAGRQGFLLEKDRERLGPWIVRKTIYRDEKDDEKPYIGGGDKPFTFGELLSMGLSLRTKRQDQLSDLGRMTAESNARERKTNEARPTWKSKAQRIYDSANRDLKWSPEYERAFRGASGYASELSTSIPDEGSTEASAARSVLRMLRAKRGQR